MRVIVTGGSGRAGAYTVRELADAGHEVTNLDMQRPNDRLPGNFIQLNLTDAGEVYDAFAQARPEGVCHLAANPFPHSFPRQQIFANNVLTTYHVMQAAGDTGVRRLIYASSGMASGWLTTEQLPRRFPIREEDRVDSPNAYALSKYLGEVMADSMVLRYPAMAICSLRVSTVIPHDRYDMLQRRRDDFAEGGNNYWSYIDARDLASAFCAALEGQSQGHETFSITAVDTGIDIPLREAVRRRYGPGASFASDHADHQSAFDCRKMERFFGWKARYSWRNM